MITSIHSDIYVYQFVMPDLIPAEDGIFDRHPVFSWIPASAGMTACAIIYDVLYKRCALIGIVSLLNRGKELLKRL